MVNKIDKKKRPCKVVVNGSINVSEFEGNHSRHIPDSPTIKTRNLLADSLVYVYISSTLNQPLPPPFWSAVLNRGHPKFC